MPCFESTNLLIFEMELRQTLSLIKMMPRRFFSLCKGKTLCCAFPLTLAEGCVRFMKRKKIAVINVHGSMPPPQLSRFDRGSFIYLLKSLRNWLMGSVGQGTLRQFWVDFGPKCCIFIEDKTLRLST